MDSFLRSAGVRHSSVYLEEYGEEYINLRYMGYIGMCGPKGYDFELQPGVLVINRVSILADFWPF